MFILKLQHMRIYRAATRSLLHQIVQCGIYMQIVLHQIKSQWLIGKVIYNQGSIVKDT